MSTIEHANQIDPDDLAKLARELGDIVEANEDREDVMEALDDLKTLSAPLGDLGYAHVLDHDWGNIEDAYRSIAVRSGSEFIADGYYVEYMKEDLSEIYQIPDNILIYIDWDHMAKDHQGDFTGVTLDGETYWIKLL